MFKGIRDLATAIMNLSETCSKASLSNRGSRLRHDELAARVATLEGTLTIKLAEAEALKIEATAEKRIARNAENRLHTLEAKRADRAEFLGDDEEGAEGVEAEYRSLVSDRDEARNGANGVPALHEGMEVPRRLTRREQAYQRISRAAL